MNNAEMKSVDYLSNCMLLESYAHVIISSPGDFINEGENSIKTTIYPFLSSPRSEAIYL